jgi:hypothetical protein
MSTDVNGSGGAGQGTDQGTDQGKGERQALYLAYRAMPVDEGGRRMTQAAAAKLAGVESATVSRWKKDSSQFAAKDREAARDGIGQARKLAKAGAWSLLSTAIYQLAVLLRDTETPPQVRAQVAMKVMDWNGAPEPVEIEVSGDPWGALLKRLAEDETDEG